MLVSIVSPSSKAVKRRRQKRFHRVDIAASEIAPALKAFGRYIAKRYRKKRAVHIPAMKSTDLGQVLRTLELNRAYGKPTAGRKIL